MNFLTLRGKSGIYSPQVANCARPRSVIVYITESMLIDCSVAYPSSTKRFMPSQRLLPEMIRLDRNRPLSRTSSSVVMLFILLFRLAKLWRNHWRRPHLNDQCIYHSILSSFSPCFSLCLLDLILSHPHSDLMFDGDCGRKFDFSSEPMRAHWALLCSTVYKHD
jgi:hypothetical protein